MEDEREAALEAELVSFQHPVDGGGGLRDAVGSALSVGAIEGGDVGELQREGVGLGAGVSVGVAGKRAKKGFGVGAHLRNRLRKPAVHGTVHQQVAEREHERQRDEGDKNGAPQHAGAEAGAKDAAALVGVELEEVADQRDEDADKEQEGNDGESKENERFDGRLRVEDGLVEGVEGAEGEEKDEKADAEGDDRRATALGAAHEDEFTPRGHPFPEVGVFWGRGNGEWRR